MNTCNVFVKHQVLAVRAMKDLHAYLILCARSMPIAVLMPGMGARWPAKVERHTLPESLMFSNRAQGLNYRGAEIFTVSRSERAVPSYFQANQQRGLLAPAAATYADLRGRESAG